MDASDVLPCFAHGILSFAPCGFKLRPQDGRDPERRPGAAQIAG
jgi:hypothetical protein